MDLLFFCIQLFLLQTSQTGGQQYSDTSLTRPLKVTLRLVYIGVVVCVVVNENPSDSF
jgi:hypothetical protein